MSTAGHILGHVGVSSVGLGAWAVPVLAGLAPAASYVFGVHRIRQRYGRRWSDLRTASFTVGCLLVAVALSPAVEHAAMEDPRGHMLQHLLLGMYAPIALVLGAPLTLLVGAAPVDARRTVRSVFGRPWIRLPTNLAVATVLNVGGLYLLYLTPLYALSNRSDAVHYVTHLHFLIAGYLFTWAVTGLDPAPARPRMAWRIAALIGAAGAHSFLAKLLYARAPALPPGLERPPAAIEAAAQWMYYGGHLAEALILTALFAVWYRRAPRLRRSARDETPVSPRFASTP